MSKIVILRFFFFLLVTFQIENFSFITYSDRDRVGEAIQKLRENGTIDRLVHKWSKKGGHCTDSDGNLLPVRRRESGPTFITMSPRDLAVPFLFLFLCGIFTAVIAALEILHTRGHFKVNI